MNYRYRKIVGFIILNLLWAGNTFAQEPDHDDCNFNEEKNIIRSQRQALADSLELLSFIPAPTPLTEPCTVPAYSSVELTFNVKKDRIYGFFNGVKNANVYLVVLCENDMQPSAPLNGIKYRVGDYIGKGRVVNCNSATAFAALELKAGTTYRIDIYAGNENCAQGIQYNAAPIFTGQKTTSATNDLNYYFGNLHSHSGYSDGNKEDVSVTPAEDYAFAKDAQCMDFLGIAEHNHFSSPGNPGMLLAKYHLGLEQANTFTANNSGFLALYGMEYGVISNGGHVVVYGIDSLLGWETLSGSPNYDIYVGKYDYSGTNGLFSTVNRFKSFKAFATLAHPEDNDYGNLLNTAYRSIVDSALVGSALENGPAFTDEVNYHDYPSKLSYLSYYKGLLARGYHIGPTFDHDNHYLTFGRTAKSRLVVLSHSLSKDDFMDAMRSRHFYVSHSCTAMLDFNVSGAVMGSVMEHAYAPAFAVSAEDASSGQVPLIKIYKGTNDGNEAVIMASGNGNTFTYTDDNLADGESAYYYADVSFGSSRTISSPVWYHRNDQATTGINPVSILSQSGRISILENPVKHDVMQYQVNEVNDGSKGIVLITDIYGKQIFTAPIYLNGKVESVNLSAFPVGTYLLSVSSSKGKFSTKFVKY